MTSKNSFWARVRENNKRRTWLWAISWLFSLFYYVMGTALVISSQKGYLKEVEQVRQITELEKKQAVIDIVANFLGANVALFLMAAIMAVFCAIQGFSYLYHRKKVDLYHSLPVKKSSRFAVIWINGIFIYMIPSLIGTLGGILVATAQGAMTGDILCDVAIKFFTTLILYVSLYNLAIIAVMLTGNMVITIFGIVVLQAYECLVRLLMVEYKQEFFVKFGRFDTSWIQTAWLSPYFIYWSDINWGQVSWPDVMMPGGKLLLLGLLFLAIGYFFYWKRPSEAAGRAMTFPITKPIIKIGIVVPAALAAAIVIKEITSGYERNAATGSPWFVAFAIFASAAVACCLIEVIYEFDIKACLHRKKYILICSGLAAAIFLGFRFDITGYDAYIPNPAKVESFALVLNTGNPNYFDEKGNYLSAGEYVGKHMFITDVEAICQLASIQPDDEEHESIVVRYRLKNGRTVDRSIYLDYSNPEMDELMNRIVSNPQYTRGAFMIMSDYYEKWLAGSHDRGVEAVFNVGAYSYMIPEEMRSKLVEAYRKDLDFINYTDLSQTIPVGDIEFQAYKKNNGEKYHYYYNYNGMHVYPNCVQTIACLKELGLYMENPVNIEDIERVEVINYNNSEQDEENQEGSYYDPVIVPMTSMSEYAAPMEDKSVTVTYHTPGEIQEVSQVICPITYYYYGDRYIDLTDQSYSVVVYFKRGTNPYEHGNSSYGYNVLKGKMPYFIQEATKYIEK